MIRLLIGGLPVWARTTVLALALGIATITIGTLIVVVVLGREVQFWPPKVGPYVSPTAQICAETLARLDAELKRLHDLQALQMRSLQELRLRRVDVADNLEKMTEVDRTISDLQGEMSELEAQADRVSLDIKSQTLIGECAPPS